jgi:hypothetical protein
MLKFDHLGLVTDQKHKGEDFVAATRVWVTNPNEHPFRIEWLRFEPDSPVAGPVRTQPHIAFSVPDLAQAGKGMEVLIEPFDVGFAVVGFYKTQDGAVVELMEYKENAEWKPRRMETSMRWRIWLLQLMALRPAVRVPSLGC